MKLVVVGCNPADRSARAGHYYSGRTNPFWTLLYDSGILPEALPNTDDKRLIDVRIRITDLVYRATREASELERQEIAEGRILLAQKLDEYAPRVVAFNGKDTYEKFAQRPCKLGLQTEKLYGARVFVLPSTGTPDSMERGIRLRYFRQLAQVLHGLPD